MHTMSFILIGISRPEPWTLQQYARAITVLRACLVKMLPPNAGSCVLVSGWKNPENDGEPASWAIRWLQADNAPPSLA